MNRLDYEDKRFLAAMQGVDLEADSTGESKSFNDIRREALGDDPETNDIASLSGSLAREEGFGIGMGLGYEIWDN
jgi:hypothetical protein